MNAFPSDVAMGDDGRVWFTDRVTSVIGRFDPGTFAFQAFPTPTPKSAPYGILTAPDGALWYAASTVGRLGRLDPKTGAIREFVLPGVTGGPHLIAFTRGTIWFSARDGRVYGRFDTRTGQSRVFAAPARFQVYSVRGSTSSRPRATVRHLAIDERRGRVWLALSDSGKIGRMDWGR